jgi:hypothetical protein
VHEKKCEGFPLFFTFKIFQTALFCDIKQWASRHRRYRRRLCRRLCRSRSKVENKMNPKDCNGAERRGG